MDVQKLECVCGRVIRVRQAAWVDCQAVTSSQWRISPSACASRPAAGGNDVITGPVSDSGSLSDAFSTHYSQNNCICGSVGVWHVVLLS